MSEKNIVDVCLVLEGTYPFISGGVSSWCHDLILSQPDKTFYLLCLSPPNLDPKYVYDVPDNVVGLTNIFLQRLPSGSDRWSHKVADKFFTDLESYLLRMQHRGDLKTLSKILDLFKDLGPGVGQRLLLDSAAAWKVLVRMYNSTMGDSSFLNYFWTWRGMMGAFFSVILAELPLARVYHSLCTGYAGLMLARARIETGSPCLLTEHGIYTNERRIEIASAKWLEQDEATNFNIDRRAYERDLKDFWVDTFASYSKQCYEACDQIVTLYQGNQKLQLMDGAHPEKMSVVPNGIDFDMYAAIEREKNDVPTVALIGRVVPIKDIKTYIRACGLLLEKLPNLKAYMLGPGDEDPDYYDECVALTQSVGLTDAIEFTGKVKISEYLPLIDVIVLTSISEAQPLTILECGAAGIPSVVTDVGACREMLYGGEGEDPPLGAGGHVVSLSDPQAVSDALYQLLTDREYYQECSKAIKTRTDRYYRASMQKQAYEDLYGGLLDKGSPVNKVSVAAGGS